MLQFDVSSTLSRWANQRPVRSSRSIRLLQATLISLPLVFAADLTADTLHLKNGRRLEGKIVYQDGRMVRIRTATGLRAVNRGLIRRLTYGPWNPGGERREAEARPEPGPRYQENVEERRQWWLFRRQGRDVAPELPREEPPPRLPAQPAAPVFGQEPPPVVRQAPITREPLKQVFKPRPVDPRTNEPLVDRVTMRIGLANGYYIPFLERTTNRYREFLFLYRELFRRNESAREYQVREPWSNTNFSMFPVSLRLHLPRSFIDADFYRSKNSPSFSQASILFAAGGSSFLQENTEFENVRVDRLFRFRSNLRAGGYLVDQDDLKFDLHGGYTSMRLYAKIDSEGFRKSFTQEANDVPVLFDFISATQRESNTEVQGPTAGLGLSYTTPFNMEFWLRTGFYSLSGDYHSTVQEQYITASSNLFKKTHGWTFVENRHEGQIAIQGTEARLGMRFPAGSLRSVFVEVAGESFTTAHSNTRAWEYGLTRLTDSDYKFKPVYQDRDEVIELFLMSSFLDDYLKGSDSFWYAQLGMDFRF